MWTKYRERGIKSQNSAPKYKFSGIFSQKLPGKAPNLSQGFPRPIPVRFKGLHRRIPGPRADQKIASSLK